MSEYISIANLFISVLIIPVLSYVVKLERRLTKIETIVEIVIQNITKKRGDKE